MIRVARFGSCGIALFLVLLVGLEVWAVAPTPTDPTGMAMGGLPGTFPTTVTAANVQVDQFTPTVFGGGGSNNLRVSFPAAGPIKWTESRHNEGDIALLIGPFDPNDSSYFPPNLFVESYQPLAGQPFANTTLAWRLNQSTGASLATVRHNGVDRGADFTYNGSPVGTIHGVAYFNADFGQGWGFRMNDGVFNNGGEGSTDLQMGIAGAQGTDGEASFDVATAYFPYEQGWTGAWVNSGFASEATFSSSSPGLLTSAVNHDAIGASFVQLPGVDSDTDGMLFVAPTHGGNNATNIAAAFPNNDGWTVSVREDDNAVVSGDSSSLSIDNGFQFLYVPYSAPGLVGGLVNGSTGAMIQSAGDASFDITRTSAGQYAISVFGAGGQRLSENDGMLILSVAGSMAGTTDVLADRAFLSYQYAPPAGDYNNNGVVDAADYVVWRDTGGSQAAYNLWRANFGKGGEFIVQSRHLAATGSPNSENQFGDDLALRDANFYFAWVSFTNPLAPAALAGTGAAVPEPTSFVLVAMLVGLLAVRPLRSR